MNSSLKVAKNSLWLIIQPLILNVVSIAATGYIARMLGEVDYGKFIFAFSFVAIFTPLASMGLRAITVREVAKDRGQAAEYTGKILATRIGLALATVIIIAFAVNIMRCNEQTKLIVYLASSTVISTSIWTTLIDILQAFENMRFVAYSQFLGGFILTILSVVVLFLGYGLRSLTMVYILGDMLTMLTAWWYASKTIGWLAIKIDWQFTKNTLAKGAPFFYPSIVAMAGIKIGVVLLSKVSGDASVGIFGAANNLVEKLIMIPDGICTAIFPTLIVMYQKSHEEAGCLFRRYFEYMLIIGLPIAVGVTILAKPIILLIYGPKFVASVPVLQILIWWLFVSFLASLQSWTLGAIHQEKKGAKVIFFTTPLYVTLNILLIPLFKEQGTALANLLSITGCFIFRSYYIKTCFVKKMIPMHRVVKIAISSVVMGLSIYLVSEWNIILSVSVGVVTYIMGGFATGVVGIRELQQFKSIVMKKIGATSSIKT